jgi:ABC-type phosphate/phosphonate transport system permease subunit
MNEPNEQQAPKRRKWSIVRKAQVISGVIGACLTILPEIPWPLNGPQSAHDNISQLMFQFYLILWLPSDKICHAFHIQQGHPWLLALEVVVNAFLCTVVGTLVGWLISLFLNRKQQR